MPPDIPIATYRVQLTANFDFDGWWRDVARAVKAQF